MSFATLQKFSQNLRGLSKTLAQDIAKAAADKITELGLRTFDSSEDSYGTPWAPSNVDGTTVDLVDKGDLRGHIKYKAIGTKLRSELGVPYAKYQVGKRPVYPKGSLPLEYIRALSEIAQRLARESLEKR